jgi:hypothetical protein
MVVDPSLLPRLLRSIDVHRVVARHDEPPCLCGGPFDAKKSVPTREDFFLSYSTSLLVCHTQPFMA